MVEASGLRAWLDPEHGVGFMYHLVLGVPQDPPGEQEDMNDHTASTPQLGKWQKMDEWFEQFLPPGLKLEDRNACLAVSCSCPAPINFLLRL